MLGFLKKALNDNVKKFSGNKDYLEAVCASSALIASADGDISDDEVAATVKAIGANAALTQAFNSREIERCAEEMLKRAQGGRTGRMGLYREIEDISSDADMAEAVVLAALDVAEADGNIDASEQAVLDKISSQLHVDLKKVMAA